MLNCGRRWGKSEFVQRWLSDAEDGALGGWPVAYVAPIYDMCTEVYASLVERLSPLIVRRVEGHRIELRGGGIIDLWSMSNGGDRIRGRRYRRLAADESALVPDLVAVWERVLRPTLADYQGEALFASTPRRGSGFEALYQRGASDEPQWSDWAAWTLPTSSNPYIAPDEIESARRGSSMQAFAQEYEANFEASESELVFPEFDSRLMVRPAPVPWQQCKWRVVGIDPGGGDPTAIVPLGVSMDERHVHQYGEMYRRGDVDIDSIVEYLSLLGPIDMVVVGETNGNIIVNSLRARGFPAHRAPLARGEGIESMRWLLQSGRFSIDPGCRDSIAEFGSYRWARARDGVTGERYATSTPVDHHADAMDARRYAWLAIVQTMPSAGVEVETQWQ